MRLLFILPIVLCLIWWLYLTMNNWTIKQGLKGFYCIFAFCGLVAGFFAVMMYVTEYHY